MKNTDKHIFISSGESSGDLLGADLARALLQKNLSLKLTGMGGPRMQEAGVSIQFDATQLSVVGFIEIFSHLPSILSTWRAIKQYLKKTKPDLVILIDFPDTHFRIMKYAKKIGIPVLYYVSPQIWAWRKKRIKQIQRYVNHMAVLFSFEEKIYRDANVPVTFVGHPLGKIVTPTLSKEAAYQQFQCDSNRPIVTILPGSRRSELNNHLSLIIEATKKIRAKKPTVQFALALADHFDPNNIDIPADIKIIQHNLYNLLQISDAVIAVSGTVTLEAALMQTPLCVIYRFNSLTFWIAKQLIRVKYIGLCNIVAEKLIAKEFIQQDATADNIANEIMTILSDQNYRDKMRSELRLIKNYVIVENKNASEMVANVAMKLAGA